MAIAVACPVCGATFRAPDAAAGRRGKCAKCGGVVQVPVRPPAPDAGIPGAAPAARRGVSAGSAPRKVAPPPVAAAVGAGRTPPVKAGLSRREKGVIAGAVAAALIAAGLVAAGFAFHVFSPGDRRQDRDPGHGVAGADASRPPHRDGGPALPAGHPMVPKVGETVVTRLESSENYPMTFTLDGDGRAGKVSADGKISKPGTWLAKGDKLVLNWSDGITDVLDLGDNPGEISGVSSKGISIRLVLVEKKTR